MTDASAVFFGLLRFAIELAGPWRVTLDFLEGLGDFDRVLHKARKVGLEVVVRELYVLL